MYNDVLQYWLKQFNNPLKLPTQTNTLDHAPRSASRRSLVPETRGGVTIEGGGHYHTPSLLLVANFFYTKYAMPSLPGYSTIDQNICSLLEETNAGTYSVTRFDQATSHLNGASLLFSYAENHRPLFVFFCVIC